eukprot:TRINITY_DN17340_c0_g1_i1.p1 TRINITY_DN17340_c0_g1~~TRINITY_DN17340_c0_g1_i1.p1  ORF type:complete len:215 (-),score=66.01 TRINITY_DN17340_c0_g1_i1:58-702(-)
MAWVAIQGSSRKPGEGVGDVLNRLKLGRASARAELEKQQQQASAPIAAGASLFKPTQLVRKEQQQQQQQADDAKKASPASSSSQKPSSRAGPFGLPGWIQKGATVLYLSKSIKNGRFKVTVKEITEQHVKIVFHDGKDTWKQIPLASARDARGPLRALHAAEASSKSGRTLADGRSRSPPAARRAAAASAQGSVEVLDDSDEDGGDLQVVPAAK